MSLTIIKFKIGEYEFNGILEILSAKSAYFNALSKDENIKNSIELSSGLIKNEEQYSTFLNFWKYLQ